MGKSAIQINFIIIYYFEISLRLLQVAQAVADKPVVAGILYKTPSAYKWEEPKPDPYSVFNVFSRQVHHGSRSKPLSSVFHTQIIFVVNGNQSLIACVLLLQMLPE